MTGPVDPGLQPERTALAWRRTSLALVALCLGLTRLAWGALGPAALLLAVVGAAGAAWLMVHERRRYRWQSTLLRDSQGVGDGIAPFLTALVTVLIASVALLSVVVRR